MVRVVASTPRRRDGPGHRSHLEETGVREGIGTTNVGAVSSAVAYISHCRLHVWLHHGSLMCQPHFQGEAGTRD